MEQILQIDSVQIDSSFRCKSIHIFSCVFGAMVSFIEFAFAFSVINFQNKKRIKVKLNWSKTWSLFFEKISRVAHIQLQWFENGTIGKLFVSIYIVNCVWWMFE